MNLRVIVDPTSVLKGLDAAGQRQLPFALALALNRTANDAQKAEQNRIAKAFKLRRDTFVIQGIKIEKADRATKTSQRVVIQVDAARQFLDKFEKGDPRIPRKGRWLWLPDLATFGNKIILRSNPLHPKNLKFDSQGKGNLRTFMVHKNGSRSGPLVLQRTGAPTGNSHKNQMRGTNGRFDGMITMNKRKKNQGIRKLFTLVSVTSTPVRLEFVSTIKQSVEARWQGNVRQALDEAMRTAR